MEKAGKIICIVLLVLTINSCETHAPEMEQLFWQINLISPAASSALHESISVYVQVNDEEGMEDLDRITVFSDSNALYWELPFKELQPRENNKIQWYGTSDLGMPDGGDFPVGEYAVRVSDLSGKFDERKFFLNTAKNDRSNLKLPHLNIGGTEIVYSGQYGTPQLWFYSAAEELVLAVELKSKTLDYSRLDKAQEFRYVSLYVYDSHLGCGIIKGKYSLTPVN